MVAAEPGNADARLLLGTALALAGARAESIAQLREVIKLRPESAAAYNSLGMALSQFLETGPAREAFQKAIQVDPKMAGAHVNLAVVLAQSGEPGLAAQHLDRAIQIEKDTPLAARAYYLRAEIHREQNELEAARDGLEQAVQLRPDFGAAWSGLGVVRRSLLDDKGALAAFAEAVRCEPNDGTAQFRLGAEYLRSGRPREAVEHLQEALRSDPDSRAVLYNLQRALREDGRVEEAGKIEARMAELLRRRSRASEKSLEAVGLNNQGVELEKGGNVFAALGKYQAALDLDPEHPGFRLNLGLALCRLGRWEEGIAQLREVVRRDPDNAQAVKALYKALEQQPRKPAREQQGRPAGGPPGRIRSPEVANTPSCQSSVAAAARPTLHRFHIWRRVPKTSYSRTRQAAGVRQTPHILRAPDNLAQSFAWGENFSAIPQTRYDPFSKCLAHSLREHQQAVTRLAHTAGLGVDSAQQNIAEVGPHAALIRPGQLASWVGCCPGREESAAVSRNDRSPKAVRAATSESHI